MRKMVMMLALGAALVWAGAPALAGYKAEIKRQDWTDTIYDQLVEGATGVRYPGDVATPAGNYQVRGGKKIPYIERCRWTFDINQLGLPTHFRQVCRRHYGRPLN